MERINRGDIWTVELVAHPKPRPALIVSINAVNDLCPDVLVVPITSQSGPLRFQLPEGLAITGLRKASYAKCESIGPIHKSRLKKRIGALPPEYWNDVEDGLRRVLGIRS
ncbi:MAG: type II toxin-antitoxin system PemK/MazF family toxin [Nitrospirae bacterium]|nr:type II toxin-antitoxin system PemK/MazF family toxin [Nitrospirota bacterium]MDA1304129.1 type II toxin-antitoxin system PemK/MazF family toxin [Nitrospirota bacterium]